MPTLLVKSEKYETDMQKATIFSNNLKQTFSLETERNFDDDFKKIVENNVNNHDFKKHKYNNKDLFDMKDLNCAIKGLKKSQLVDRIKFIM